MSAFPVFRRWPIATGLFVLHAVFVLLVYIWWATSSSVERGMIWMTVFLLDLPSSYLFLDGPTLFPISAVFIGDRSGRWSVSFSISFGDYSGESGKLTADDADLDG